MATSSNKESKHRAASKGGASVMTKVVVFIAGAVIILFIIGAIVLR